MPYNRFSACSVNLTLNPQRNSSFILTFDLNLNGDLNVNLSCSALTSK